MPIPVVMPQMGESIAEGTIVRWIKKVGDAVDRDEPLFEISTDKVDAEIPSPAAGILTDIAVSEGETVAVNSVVATIGQQGDVVARESGKDSGKESGKDAKRDQAGAQARQATGSAPAAAQPQPDGSPVSASGTPAPAADEAAAADEDDADEGRGPSAAGDGRRQKSSPLVRRIAKDNHVDIAQIHGSGIGGRVTKSDILGFIESGGAAASQGAAPAAAGATAARPGGGYIPAYREGERVDIKPLSVMRKKIAEHMVLSRRTSAHVHTVFHVNFSTVDKIRQQKKAQYEANGAKLTYMGFITKAVIDALRRHPVLNASLDGDKIVYKKDINIGIAVALDTGLIVPVVKNADEKNMLGLSRAIADVAERARTKQLSPEDVQGGTFTITNPGHFGAQFGMPIINQPQVAILGVGTVEKRPVVQDDALAIRTMAYLTLGFDHRLVDGAVADQFMADIKQQLEHFDASQV